MSIRHVRRATPAGASPRRSGRFVSLVGTWMQQVAPSWLVYRITGPSLSLGVVGFASQFPVFVLALFGGVLADRFSHRAVLVGTQTVALIQASVLAALTFSGHVQLWHVVAMAACNTIVQTLCPDELRGRVMALYSMMFMGMIPFGALLSGALAHWTSAGTTVTLSGAAWVLAVLGGGRRLLALCPPLRPARAAAKGASKPFRNRAGKKSSSPVDRKSDPA